MRTAALANCDKWDSVWSEGCRTCVKEMGITGQSDNRVAVLMKRKNMLNTYGTNTYYISTCKRTKCTQTYDTHSWCGHKKFKWNITSTSCWLALYIRAVWPRKPQIQGHYVTVPVNSQLYLFLRKSQYVQSLNITTTTVLSTASLTRSIMTILRRLSVDDHMWTLKHVYEQEGMATMMHWKQLSHIQETSK